MFQNISKIKRNQGQAMLVSILFFLFIALAIIGGLVAPSVREFKIANDLIYSKQSFFLSESGIEDVYYRLIQNLPIESPSILTLNGYTATSVIEDSGYNEKTITTQGDVSNRDRTNQLVLTDGSGTSFSYGIQAGTGGFIIGNAYVDGNVFSNGQIIGSNGATIYGSAISAGPDGLIDNVIVGVEEGDAMAHTINDTVVYSPGNMFCKTGSGNSPACETNFTVPDPIDMPISDEQIEEWKGHAELGGTHTGNMTISSPTSLGPIKITGNLYINAALTMTGTIYVEGEIFTRNNVDVTLDEAVYGETGGIIVTDSKVNLANNMQFEGTNSPDSYILLLTTSSCPDGCGGVDAMEVLNNVGAVILNAQNGTIHLHNNISLSEVVAETIILNNSASIVYETGLVNTQFTSGPEGGWGIISWGEIE